MLSGWAEIGLNLNLVFCWLFAIAVVIFVVVVVSRREIHKNLEVTRRAIVLLTKPSVQQFSGGLFSSGEWCKQRTTTVKRTAHAQSLQNCYFS